MRICAFVCAVTGAWPPVHKQDKALSCSSPCISSPRLKSESIHSISVSNSILLPKVALPGTPILFHFLPLIILTARTSGVSRRYTIERHLAKTSRKRIKSISLYSLLKSVMTAVKTAQGLQDDFKCAKIRLNIQTHKRLLPVHNAVTCSPTLCLVTHLKAHVSHHRARNTPQATCLVEKGLNERGMTAKCSSVHPTKKKN